MHRNFLIPRYMMNHEQASMELHCQIHSSLSQTSLTGFNYDSMQPLVTFHGPFIEQGIDNKFFKTKLISCADNSKIEFNDETDVLLISALFSASKLLLTEQLIG